jgi:hypothetical protein
MIQNIKTKNKIILVEYGFFIYTSSGMRLSGYFRKSNKKYFLKTFKITIDTTPPVWYYIGNETQGGNKNEYSFKG